MNNLNSYEGFKNILNPPPHSDSDNSTAETEDVTEALSTSLKHGKINESSIPYLQKYSVLKYHLGSEKHVYVTVPFTANSFKTSFTTSTDYPVIIDSGATHHMWSDPAAFISFAPTANSYVSLANNFRIPVKGVGSIHLKING